MAMKLQTDEENREISDGHHSQKNKLESNESIELFESTESNSILGSFCPLVFQFALQHEHFVVSRVYPSKNLYDYHN